MQTIGLQLNRIEEFLKRIKETIFDREKPVKTKPSNTGKGLKYPVIRPPLDE